MDVDKEAMPWQKGRSIMAQVTQEPVYPDEIIVAGGIVEELRRLLCQALHGLYVSVLFRGCDRPPFLALCWLLTVCRRGPKERGIACAP